MRRLVITLFLTLLVSTASAQGTGGKLLLTGGVTQVEGASGAGLSPWAVIGGYGTRDQIGANAFYTFVKVDDYELQSTGALVGLYDRVELSFAQQQFDTRAVGAALGLGQGFKFKQDVLGIKVRLAGDALYDQDSLLPQLSIGLQHKRNDRGSVVRSVGAKDADGTDFYLAATKILLDKSLLLSGTLRATKANQLGILGFGGDARDRYTAQFEGSVVYLLSRKLAVGAEVRTKPNNLRIAKEDDWYDAFVAWAPTKNVAIVLAYTYLGNIVIKDDQKGFYLSAQVGF